MPPRLCPDTELDGTRIKPPPRVVIMHCLNPAQCSDRVCGGGGTLSARPSPTQRMAPPEGGAICLSSVRAPTVSGSVHPPPGTALQRRRHLARRYLLSASDH